MNPPRLLAPAAALAGLLALGACGERHTGASAEPAAPAPAPSSSSSSSSSSAADSAATPVPASAPAVPEPGPDSPTNRSIQRVLGDPAPYQATILAFQRAVIAGDAAAAAALVRFPLRVAVDGKPREIADAAAFVRDYAAIITPEIARTISAQSYDTLLVNQQGVSFDGGTVWIGGSCRDSACARQDVKVVTVQAAPPAR